MRLPRYEMLIKQLVKNTPSDHVDYQYLVKALDGITHTNDLINKKLKEQDERNKVQIIEDQFFRKKANLTGKILYLFL